MSINIHNNMKPLVFQFQKIGLPVFNISSAPMEFAQTQIESNQYYIINLQEYFYGNN